MLDVMAAPIIDRALYCSKEGAERDTECALSVIITEQYLLVKPCVSPSGPRVYFTIATLRNNIMLLVKHHNVHTAFSYIQKPSECLN